MPAALQGDRLGAAAVVAVLLWKGVSRTEAAPCLLLAALGVTLWLQPLGLVTAPSLDAVMSPRAQGEERA